MGEKRGRIPTKTKRSPFQIHRDELSLAYGNVVKEEPKGFDPAFTDHMNRLKGDAVSDVWSADGFVIGKDSFDTPEGEVLFSSKGVTMIGSEMFNAKRVILLCTIAGMVEGITVDELLVTMNYPSRVNKPDRRELVRPLALLSNCGWISVPDSDDTSNVLITITKKGSENLKRIIDCLEEKEKTMLQIGSERRVAIVKRERAAGRGFCPVPKVDETKPAYDRIDQVFALADYLMKKDGGKIESLRKE
jgi:hypothetical protein